MHNFKELDIWKDSKEFCYKIYQVTRSYPEEERFGMINQLRRASVSIPSNIAEGSSRQSNKEFAHFICVALGSCYEVQTQLEISAKLGFIQIEKEKELITELEILQRKINKFYQYLRTQI